MADNVPITAGAGTSIATDDVGGVHYPRNKIALGADGSATDAKSTDLDSGAGSDIALVAAIGVPASGGGVIITGDGANGLDVDVTRLPSIPAGTNNIGDVDVLTLPGTVEADIAAIKTAVEALDNAVAGSELQVDVVTLPGTVQADIAAIKTAVEVLDNVVAGSEAQVDVITLPSLPAGTNNIGDVDIVSLPNEGQQTMANSISVAVASDQSAIKAVAVNGFESTDNIFVASVVASAAGASKNHLSIYNADATLKVDILQVYVTKEVTAAVTGLIRGHRLFRFGTLHSAGSTVTPLQLDTTMTPALDGDITVRAGSTVSGAEAIPLGVVGVNEEETASAGNRNVLFDWRDYNRPITLNTNQGVTVQQDSTAGTGLISVVIVFRQR